MKTATTMIEMKVETIIIDTKIVSVNQVLVTIRLNPVARIKQSAVSDTVFNFQSPWRHCLQSTSPIIFSLSVLFIYVYMEKALFQNLYKFFFLCALSNIYHI